MKEFYEKRRDIIYFILAIIASLAFYLAPFPDSFTVGERVIELSMQGRTCMALLIFAIVLWVTEAVPFAITSLIVMLLMPLIGVTEGLEVAVKGGTIVIHGAAAGLKEMVKMSFGNRLIIFFLGVFLLSGAFIKSGLGERLTQWLLLIVGTNTKMVILGFLFMGSSLSMWITDMAVAALLVPLGVSILQSADIKPQESNFGKALMISCCWGAVFGGIGTPAGCGPNPIAIEYLRTLAGIEISFLDWMKIGVPATFILVPVGWFVITTIFPPEIKKLPMRKSEIREKLKEKGRPSKAEMTTMIVFITVIVLWLTTDVIKEATGGRLVLSMEMVALAGGLVFFLPGIRVFTSWKDAEPLMNWGAIVLVMASLSLGLMMYETGAARWLAWVLMGNITLFHPIIQIAIVIAAVLLMKLFLASNTVTGIIIIPLLITLAGDLGIDYWFLVAPAAFTASLGVILLTQSPTNIIPFTAGYFSVKDFAISGIILTIVMIVVLTAVFVFIGPLTGMYSF
jgi:solute carrier family 13 (sodium-dependent dicarboxylate transporter), member 2/3/5